MVATADPKAAKWCATGALSSIADINTNGLDAYIDAESFLHEAVRGKHKGDMVSFNDAKGRKYEQVIAVYDRAIDSAVRKGL